MIDIYSDEVDSVTFEGVHLDSKTNTVHIWERVNGQKQYVVYQHTLIVV